MRRKSRVAVAHTTKKKQRHAQAGICRWPVNLLMVLALAEMLLAVYLYRYESPLDDIAKLPDFPIIQLDPKLDKNEPPLDYMAELPDFPTIQLNPELDKIDFQTYKSKPLVFDKFTIPDYSHHTRRASDENGVEKTIRNLKEMGVPSEELERNETSVEMPPWSQIVDNYGDEPVILGLERCEAYRNMVPEKNRFIGPAGLFSTGTNLLNSLLMKNCNPPPGKGHSKFYFWQVPWGKHNPAFARTRYVVPSQIIQNRNQTAFLPIVTVRHPYPWMLALCKHYYSLLWPHSNQTCDQTLSLHEKVHADYGATTDTVHDSLAHVWRDWNALYFKEQSYPLLIIRHADLVYRPRFVIAKICECVGGNLGKEFYYQKQNSNLGAGHGGDRSDLKKAWIKYGQPLDLYHNKFSRRDWEIIEKMLKNDHGMMKAFNYHE